MEITDVTAVIVDAPPTSTDEHLEVAPHTTNHGEFESVGYVLVRVDIDGGIENWGEMCMLLPPTTAESLIEDGIGPMVVSQSPFRIERLRRRVFVEYTNVDVFFSTVETACWDIVGKALDRPVYELSGGWTTPTRSALQHRSHMTSGTWDPSPIPVASCLGILSPGESRMKAREALDTGFDVFKTKVGRDWRRGVARIKTMHDETDGQLEFRLGPNQGWTLDQAVRVDTMLEDEGIYLQYLEQPTRVDSHVSLARLRQRLQ